MAEYQRLDEACHINMGQSPDSKSYNLEGVGLPFFQGNADFGAMHPETRVWCSSPTKIVEAGTLLISVRAPIGALNFAKERSCIGRGLAGITPQNGVSLKYIYYCLKGKNKELNAKGTGSTFKAIAKSALGETSVKIVSEEDQLKIIQTLDRVSSVIEARKQQLTELDNLIKARFVELFGDPVANPHGFDKVALSELADIKIGPFGSLLHKEDYIEGGHALLNPSHIIDGKVAPDYKLTVSAQKYEELSAYHLKAGDVVMGRRGEMGRCAVVPSDGYLCGTGSLMIRTKGEVTADYIQKIISFPSFKKTIEDMAVGQTMPNLNVPIVSNFQIIKPPIEVQKSYYTFVEQVDKSKVVESIHRMNVLFNITLNGGNRYDSGTNEF